LDPEKKAGLIAWFVGQVLHSWLPGETLTAWGPEYDAEAFWAATEVRNRIARAFADVWIYGRPKTIYPASDPRALELLALVGLDHFPELAEARQLEQERPESVAVEVEGVTQPYVMFLRGLVVLHYADPVRRAATPPDRA
jgi:hypothetical protein